MRETLPGSSQARIVADLLGEMCEKNRIQEAGFSSSELCAPGLTESCLLYPEYLHFGQRHAVLPLIFSTAILVRGFAHFVGFEEQHLCHALVGINLGG